MQNTGKESISEKDSRANSKKENSNMVAKKNTNAIRSRTSICVRKAMKKLDVKAKKLNTNILEILKTHGSIRMSYITLLENNPGLQLERVWELSDTDKSGPDLNDNRAKKHVMFSDEKADDKVEDSDADTIIVSDLDPADITSPDELSPEASPSGSRQHPPPAASPSRSKQHVPPAVSSSGSRQPPPPTAADPGTSTEEFSDDDIIIEDASSPSGGREVRAKQQTESSGNISKFYGQRCISLSNFESMLVAIQEHRACTFFPKTNKEQVLN